MGFRYLLPHGWFENVGDNETSLVSSKEDPPKHRQGVLRRFINATNRTLGCMSFNIVDDDGRQEEMVLVQGKKSDLGGGELWFGAKKPGSGSSDPDEMVTMDWTRGVMSKVPIHAPNIGSGGSVGYRLLSPNGRWLVQIQDDGNLVKYELVNGEWVARWATGV